MSDNVNAREQRMRRLLARGGFRLHKTPARSWLREYYDLGYMITFDNVVQVGCHVHDYDASLEDVEYWAPLLVSEEA